MSQQERNDPPNNLGDFTTAANNELCLDEVDLRSASMAEQVDSDAEGSFSDSEDGDDMEMENSDDEDDEDACEHEPLKNQEVGNGTGGLQLYTSAEFFLKMRHCSSLKESSLKLFFELEDLRRRLKKKNVEKKQAKKQKNVKKKQAKKQQNLEKRQARKQRKKTNRLEKIFALVEIATVKITPSPRLHDLVKSFITATPSARYAAGELLEQIVNTGAIDDSYKDTIFKVKKDVELGEVEDLILIAIAASPKFQLFIRNQGPPADVKIKAAQRKYLKCVFLDCASVLNCFSYILRHSHDSNPPKGFSFSESCCEELFREIEQCPRATCAALSKVGLTNARMSMFALRPIGDKLESLFMTGKPLPKTVEEAQEMGLTQSAISTFKTVQSVVANTQKIVTFLKLLRQPRLGYPKPQFEKLRKFHSTERWQEKQKGQQEKKEQQEKRKRQPEVEKKPEKEAKTTQVSAPAKQSVPQHPSAAFHGAPPPYYGGPPPPGQYVPPPYPPQHHHHHFNSSVHSDGGDRLATKQPRMEKSGNAYTSELRSVYERIKRSVKENDVYERIKRSVKENDVR